MHNASEVKTWRKQLEQSVQLARPAFAGLLSLDSNQQTLRLTAAILAIDRMSSKVMMIRRFNNLWSLS